VLGAIVFVGMGYLHSHRAQREATDRREAVHAMSLQALAAAIARCDAPLTEKARRGAAGRDDRYCEEVARELDDRPLEVVQVEPAQAPTLPRPH
jgi:hypothetical protein